MCVLILFAALSSTGCSSLFFYPTRVEYIRAEEIGLTKEDVVFNNRHGEHLTGWWLPATAPVKGTLLFLHGNAENVSSHVMSVNWLPERGWNVFALDYRGYGRSPGSPSFAGCIEDGEDALEWVRNKPGVDPNKIILFGQSIGASFAINIAAIPEERAKLRALVADSGFSSFPGILRDKLGDFWLTWPFQYPLSIFITGKYDPVTKLGELDNFPVLFIHGEADQIVPVYHSDRMYAASHGDKLYWRVPGAPHIGSLRLPEYRKRLLEYLDRVI